MERLYADWVDEYEQNGIRFIDPDFKYDDHRNFGGRLKNNYHRIPNEAKHGYYLIVQKCTEKCIESV